MSVTDQIIVKTQADMNRIADWVATYLREEHQADLDAPVEFVPPFGEGEIMLLEESIAARFKYVGGGDVAFDVKAGKNNTHVGSFVYNYSTSRIHSRKFDPAGVDMRQAIELDDQNHFLLNLSAKWMALMLLAVYYRPEFERKQRTTATKKPARKSKKGRKPAKTIYTRQYVLTGDFVDALPKAPRSHAKPQHEFSVRGHYRRYKSGKTVWINQHTRCKGRGDPTGRTYIASVREEDS